MYLALLSTDTENQLLFPLWRTLFEDRILRSLSLEALRHNSHLNLSSRSHFKVFDTSYSSPLSRLQKIHTSSLKCNTQIPNQTPAELWPTLREAKSMTLWLCQTIFIAQGCCSSGADDTVVHWCAAITWWGWCTDCVCLHKRSCHVPQHR